MDLVTAGYEVCVYCTDEEEKVAFEGFGTEVMKEPCSVFLSSSIIFSHLGSAAEIQKVKSKAMNLGELKIICKEFSVFLQYSKNLAAGIGISMDMFTTILGETDLASSFMMEQATSKFKRSDKKSSDVVLIFSFVLTRAIPKVSMCSFDISQDAKTKLFCNAENEKSILA